MRRPAASSVLTAAVLAAALALLPVPAGAAGIESQTNYGDLGDALRAIFNLLLNFLPAVATIYLAISGYRYMISQGNPDLMEKAKKNLTYAVIGVVVAYSAFLIIRLVGRQLGFGLAL